MNRLKPVISALSRFRAIVIAVVVCLTAALPACRHKADVRLGRISQYVGNEPEKALAALDSIDYSSLPTPDRHLYDFLSIKARDKAYVVHTSDSLILDVIRWYESHPEYGLHPDALYYGGRVYSDLGDKPAALRYFHKALDLLPENTDKPALRACVVSQTGGLLDNLRLYREAIPYIKESIRMDRMLRDTLNELYDLHLLGSTEIRDSNYNEAMKAFRVALAKSKDYSEELHSMSRMYLGAAKYYVGDLDSALLLVRNTPDSVSELAQSSALAYAARIYQRAGFPDTALYYAERLIHHPKDVNKTVAYQILLSPELSGVVSPDSLPVYARGYGDILSRHFNENSNQLALDRQNLYNYDIHDREREKAESSNIVLKRWLAVSGLLIMLLAFVVLIIKIRTQRKIIQLHRALESLSRLRLSVDTGVNEEYDADNEGKHATDSYEDVSMPEEPHEESTGILRERLKKKLTDLYNVSEKVPLADSIIRSEAYMTLQKRIEAGKIIREDDPLWQEIEKIVLKVSPEFINNLRILTLGNLSGIDLKTALLLKCQIKPSQMRVIFGKSNGAIISRRASLSRKVLDGNTGVKMIDGIIRLL